MASGGPGDVEIVGGLSANTDDTVYVNIETDNRFSVLEDRGRDESIQEQERKRKRANTGSVDSDTFQTLSSDDKLGVIFSKLIDIEHKQTQIENLEKAINSTRNSIGNMTSDIQSHDKMLKLLNYKSVDLEARSRRKNLILRGLFEVDGENCYRLVYDFLEDQLQLDDARSSIVIDRAHRLGKRRNRAFSRRPIIVAFRDFADTERVLSRGYLLKGTRFGVDRDYPMEINKARGVLWNRYKELKRAGKNVSMQYPAKLVMDGRVIENALPDWYDILQEQRVEPFESECVKKANERAKLNRNSASEIPTNQDSSSREINTSTGRQLRDNEVPSGWLSAEMLGKDNGTQEQNTSSFEAENDEEDEADAAFYSGYVSRMDTSGTDRISTTSAHNDITPVVPQTQQNTPVLLSMKEYPPLPERHEQMCITDNRNRSISERSKNNENKQPKERNSKTSTGGNTNKNLAGSLRPRQGASNRDVSQTKNASGNKDDQPAPK